MMGKLIHDHLIIKACILTNQAKGIITTHDHEAECLIHAYWFKWKKTSWRLNSIRYFINEQVMMENESITTFPYNMRKQKKIHVR